MDLSRYLLRRDHAHIRNYVPGHNWRKDQLRRGFMKSNGRDPQEEPTPEMIDEDWNTLIATIEDMQRASSFDDILVSYCQATRKIMGADGVTFVLRDGEFCRYVDEDAISPLWKGKQFPMSACISGWCMHTGKTAVIPDIYKDDRIPHFVYKTTFVKSLVMTPVGSTNALAAVGAYWATEQHPGRYTIRMMERLAHRTVGAIERIRTLSPK